MSPAPATQVTMSVVQIVAITTTEIGPAGPMKKIFAVAMDDRVLALAAIQKKLKSGETADWIDARSLTIGAGEIRQI